MPSVVHDTLNQLFRDHPEFAVRVLSDALGADLPVGAPVRVAQADFNDRPSRDFQADTVITLGPMHDPVHGIIVEIQREIDDGKRISWLRYAAALWLRLDCWITVLVICPDAKTAAWAERPITAGWPGLVLTPKVLGPASIPVITDPEDVASSPEMATLSVMAHGEQLPVAEVFMAGLERVDPEYAKQYAGYAYRMASLAAQRIMEDIMTTTDWLAGTRWADEFGRARLAEGEARGEAQALLTFLRGRSVSVSEDAQARIASCTDLKQLDEWIRRAATVNSVDELFS